MIEGSALVSGSYAGAIFIDLCLIKRGFEKAVELLEKGEEKGVFVWAPRLKYWLKEPDYIFWLGTVR
ncbi:MAG: hypothetical protein WA977_10165 [Halobacteriota archaeon]